MRRDENKLETHRAILEAGRARFGQLGYEGATLAQVAADAGVTTGAIYHHFVDKRGLFLAVAEQVEGEVLNKAATSAAGITDPWALLDAAFNATLEMCREPDIRQIILLDAANVIGAAQWRTIELKYGYGLMRQILSQMERDGVLIAPSIDILAPILLGALLEAANAVAMASAPQTVMAQARATLNLLLEGLKARKPLQTAGNP